MFFFVFKQKTAYELRISDWSSDVCSSDLERYDRMIRRRTWRRVHQEDMCQALGLHPSQKYQSDGGPSPDKIADLLRVSMPPRAASSAVEAFVDELGRAAGRERVSKSG